MNDLDLEQTDLDADAMRDIDTTVDRSTTAADLAAALTAGHINVGQYAEHLAAADEPLIDPALLEEDEDEDDEEDDQVSVHESDVESSKSDKDESSTDSDAGPGSDYEPDADEEEVDDEPVIDADSDDGSGGDNVPAPTDTDADAPDVSDDNTFFPSFISPFVELHELLARNEPLDFLSL